MGRAVELVREHWNKIELVAQALLDWKSDGTGALEVLCELADAPEGYADAVRALALMGKLPRSGDVVSVPPWLAAARYPRGEMEPKKHRALARTGGRVATVKELLGLSDEEAAAVEKRLEAEQDGQDNDAAPDAKRER